MRICAAVIAVVVLSACAQVEEATGFDLGKARGGSKFQAACQAVSTATLAVQKDRSGYLERIAEKYQSVNVGYSPMAQLAATAIRNGDHRKAAGYLRRLTKAACSKK